MRALVLTKHNELADIDPHVLGLVASLQQAGYHTLASCQGHAIGGHTPYVYFQCPQEQAQALDLMVTQCRTLHSRWEVTAHFGVAGLTWLLRSPTWEAASRCGRLGLLPALWRRAGHQHLAEDLHQLAQLIAQAPSTPPRVTTWQHMVTVIRDMFRMGIGRFRFEIGMLVGILLGLMMA
ncbi:MAG: hypothetical protein ACRC16_22505 [Aeromonas salmonicida]